MPIGMRIEAVNCLEETTSGRWQWVRNRRRRAGSDEIGVFAAVHDAATGRLLTVYRHHRDNVDSGDSLAVAQSVLAPEDSTDAIIVTLVGYEFDGRGALSTLVKAKYEEWVSAVGSADWGLSVENARLDAAIGVLLVPPFATRVLHDDLIFLDRFEVDAAMFGGPAAPPALRYAPSEAEPGLSISTQWERRGFAGTDGRYSRLESTHICTARAEDSVYGIEMTFTAST